MYGVNVTVPRQTGPPKVPNVWMTQCDLTGPFMRFSVAVAAPATVRVRGQRSDWAGWLESIFKC